MQNTAPHPSANQIKHRLRREGHTLKSWAAANGFKYRTVSDAVRGLRQGNFGEGRDVRVALGLPVND
ncbi:DNA-binding protein [Ottowia sp.]|uniref:DNA-binding protein n=1 Tax=Ottowia sp. TaxID=1898956 RepID=UPI003A884F38